jgi:hypothetical protein
MPSVAVKFDFREILERVGLDPMHSSGLPVSRHTMYVPIGLALDRDEYGDEFIRWDAVEMKEFEPGFTVQCLWDFVALRDPTTREVQHFVEKWGLVDLPETEHDAGELEFPEFISAAAEARGALLLIAATEAGELVSEPVLDALYHWDEFPVNAFEELERRGEPMSSPLYHDILLEKKREHWRAERSAGRGLDLQRRLLTNFINGWVSQGPGHGPRAEPLELLVTWDASGRHVDWVAYGVRAIVGSHLLSMLSAPQIDVFTCSICGSPFPFDPLQRQRRPAAGRRQLCSSACKEAARRADNRASWHKNKSKWTRSRHRRQGA